MSRTHSVREKSDRKSWTRSARKRSIANISGNCLSAAPDLSSPAEDQRPAHVLSGALSHMHSPDSGMIRRRNISLLIAVSALLAAETAQARSTRLTCRDSGNLYERPYSVVIDSQNMLLQINKTTGALSGRGAYPIEQVDADSDGFVVTARGRALNAAIKVAVSPDDKWISYTDAFTDRSFAIDYCR